MTFLPQSRHPQRVPILRAMRCLTWFAVVAVLIASPDGAGLARATSADPVILLPPVTGSGDRLGTCYANYPTKTGGYFTPMAASAGSRWDRVDFAWDRIADSDIGYAPYDDLVERDAEHGLSTVGILMGTPTDVADCDTTSAARAAVAGLPDPPFLPLHASALEAARTCPPKNLYLPWDHPANHWAQFVRETVARYRGQVHVWEIWNEPDLWNWFWTGSVEDYAQLLKVGYQAVKAEDPDATVLFAGLAYWANPSYYVSVLDVLRTMPEAEAHNFYFDAMSLHLYSSIYTIGPVVGTIQTAMTERVGPHPIWLTEAGVPLWDEDPADPNNKLNRATAEEAAAYTIEAFAEARAAGVERFFFFRTHDNEMDEGPFGLVRDDASLRPSYVAYQVAATYLHDENQVTRPGLTPEGVQRITFWGTPRGRVDVLWNATGAALDYDYPVLLPEVTVVTQRGITTTLANTGTVQLHLEPATAYNGEGSSLLIGGPPLLVVQSDTVSPTSRLDALPPVWYGHAVTLTWEVTDSAGAQQPGAGHWYTEIERAPSAAGPWTLVAGWPTTQYTTTVTTRVPTAGTWYFRARARDGAGNWEPWPASSETEATVFVTRTVQMAVSTYLDANSNGVQEPGEEPTNTTTLTWTSAAGDLIDRHTGWTWTTTATVEEGDYLITARAPGYLPAFYLFHVTAGPDLLELNASIGLHPIQATLYLPLLHKES